MISAISRLYLGYISQVDVCRVRPDWAEARVATTLATPLALSNHLGDLGIEIEVLETTPVELTLSQRLPREWRHAAQASRAADLLLLLGPCFVETD